MIFRSAAVAALSWVALSGCSVQTDLGKECFLVRRSPDGGAIRLNESEIKPDKDFISFGAVECEDLVCVRDSTYTRQSTSGDALGYCSRPCVVGSTTGCPAANPEDDRDPARRLTCRALLLDAETLAAIRQQNPELSKRYFGDTESPYFCARGSTPDGGR